MNLGRLLIPKSEKLAVYLDLFFYLALVLSVQLVKKNMFLNYSVTLIPSWKISLLILLSLDRISIPSRL